MGIIKLFLYTRVRNILGFITTEKLVISQSQLTFPFAVASIAYQKCDDDDDDDEEEEEMFYWICPGSVC